MYDGKWKKMRKSWLVCLGLVLCLLAGCSMENTKGSIKRIDAELVSPAVKLWEEYRSAEADMLKKKPGLAGYQAMVPQAEKVLPELKELKKKIKAEPAMRMTENYLYYAALYVERIAGRLEYVVKSSRDKKLNLQSFKGQLWLWDNRNLVEARLGYDREKKLLLTGEESYQLTQTGVRKLRKGMTYEQVMAVFQMPGAIMPGIREVRNGKTVTHWPAIWELGDDWVYVDLVNGRAEYWRTSRIERMSR